MSETRGICGLLPEKAIIERYATNNVVKNPEIVKEKYKGVWLNTISKITANFPINGIILIRFIAIPYNKDIIANINETKIA